LSHIRGSSRPIKAQATYSLTLDPIRQWRQSVLKPRGSYLPTPTPIPFSPSPPSPSFPSPAAKRPPSNQLGGLGERCELPQRVRAEPGRQTFLVHFEAEKGCPDDTCEQQICSFTYQASVEIASDIQYKLAIQLSSLTVRVKHQKA
jgi:hypothetical protein